MTFTPLTHRVNLPEKDNLTAKITAAILLLNADYARGIQLGNYSVTGNNDVVSLDALAFLPDNRVILFSLMYFKAEGYWTLVSAEDFITGAYCIKPGAIA